MSDEWMPTLRMKLTRAEFDRLPRHPAFKYELIDGETWISPWPRHAHAQLTLSCYRPDKDDGAALELRRGSADDVAALAPVFCDAFGNLQPYASLDQDTLTKAAETSLQRTFVGVDGPLVESASFVALKEERLIGAILITLLPGGDPNEWDCVHWQDPPPTDLWDKRQGQPHLTWIFVERLGQGEGIGTQLLRASVDVLERHGYQTMWTTFLIGNDVSALWHWRNGFELFPALRSKRRMRRELTHLGRRASEGAGSDLSDGPR